MTTDLPETCRERRASHDVKQKEKWLVNAHLFDVDSDHNLIVKDLKRANQADAVRRNVFGESNMHRRDNGRIAMPWTDGNRNRAVTAILISGVGAPKEIWRSLLGDQMQELSRINFFPRETE